MSAPITTFLKSILSLLIKVSRWLFSTLSDLYVASLIGYLLLRFLTHDRFWFVEFYGIFLPFVLIGGSVLFMVHVVTWLFSRISFDRYSDASHVLNPLKPHPVRFPSPWQGGQTERSDAGGSARRKVLTNSIRLVFLILPPLIFLILYGERYTSNRTAHACDDCTSLRVMTYNIGPDIIDPDQMVADFIASDADIIAIQELGYEPSLHIIADLSEIYPYQVLNPRGIPGTGLLSKYPILESEEFKMVDGTGLFHLRATVDVDGQIIQIVSAHPPPPAFWHAGMAFTYNSSLRSQEIHALVGTLDTSHPLILLGDFNTGDQTGDYAFIRGAGLTDAYRKAGRGLGLSWPNMGKYHGIQVPRFVRIDYIWVSDQFTVRTAWRGHHAGSDHMPMLADLVLVGE